MVVKKDGKEEKPKLKNFLGEVEKRAYEMYLERMKTGSVIDSGKEMNDWLKAEKEIKAKYNL